MSHQATAMMSGGGGAGQFGDTTLTKVFVGGLAWETHKDGMRAYFQQFGDILEAVVITDKNTGRSKGYGFVSSSQTLPTFLRDLFIHNHHTSAYGFVSFVMHHACMVVRYN